VVHALLRSAKNYHMETGDKDITSVQLNDKLSMWEEWRGIVFFILIVVGSSIAIWHIGMIQPIAPMILLGIGLFFDILSLIARISTVVTGRYSSGFFVVGFVFYLWAWISYPHAVLLGDSQGLLSLWIWKLPDIICLAALHLAIHVSFGRDGDGSDNNKSAEQVAAPDR
jgi:hypothetical protein